MFTQILGHHLPTPESKRLEANHGGSEDDVSFQDDSKATFRRFFTVCKLFRFLYTHLYIGPLKKKTPVKIRQLEKPNLSTGGATESVPYSLSHVSKERAPQVSCSTKLMVLSSWSLQGNTESCEPHRGCGKPCK